MKKETSGGGSKNPKPKILGSIPRQIIEGDAGRLVGGIVEKGFSGIPPTGPLGPSTAPRPTVLPFPVARHRSHGPHWAPKVGNINLINNDNDDMDLDDGEDEDRDGMEVAAGVAKPVERKEKKGLDFSRWKEIAKNDNNSVLPEKKKEIGSTVWKIGRKAKEIHSVSLSKEIADPDEGVLQWARANKLYSFRNTKNGPSNEMQADWNIQKSEIGGEKESLESQIDAENCDRLAKMSADEIAEARAELMAKLDPALINVLKARAQSKVKRPKFSSPDSTQPEKINTATSDNTIISENLVKDKDDNKATSSNNISPENRSMWVAWSKRVECARDLRFSLEGNIISSVSDSGKASSESGYNADNVSERDFIRTEGDPGAVGYTIKEAVELARSVVPGQRTFALHLIASVLDKAISGICQRQVDFSDAEGDVDWEAIWAFALGPEPELALALRMSLDDNFKSVVLACAKAIQSALSCDLNDTIFDILENTPTYARDVCTAPVFRSKPDVNVGFLRGGFWKYNTKTSNIRCFVDEELKGEKAEEGERTIQDDVFVAGQDFAAGLVRMGILPRICYLLETDPSAQLEEWLISILIAVARHSPTCGAAILNCERLVQTIFNKFASNEQMEINSSKIKSVTLLKVLARLEKKNCLKFKNEGILQKVTWHLYRYPFSLDQWVRSGKEACKLSSALLVEQLRLWKIFVRYGYCISEISNLLASFCIWLSVPSFDNLIFSDTMNEYCAITNEAYLLLGVLAGQLPNYYSRAHEKTEEEEESCSWSFFGSVIDLALEWIQVKNIPYLLKLFNCQNKDDEINSEVNSVIWVISSVLNMLSSVLKAVTPDDIASLPNGRLPWLPEFVPKMGLELIKNGYLRPDNNFYENGSLVEYLCRLRAKNKTELGLSSTCCLQGLVQVVDSIDKLIRHANLDIHKAPSFYDSLSWEDKVLANGIHKSCVDEVRSLLNNLMILIINEWQCMRPVEIFSRGGPAPGVGVGWGASGGGYWSWNNFLGQQDARLLVYLLEITEIPFGEDPLEALQMVNCALTACLVVGPGNNSPVIDKLLKFMFQAPVLKYLDSGIRKFLSFRKGHGLNYEEDEYESFANVLEAHFRSRWLSVKKRKVKSTKKGARALETIYEDSGEELSSLRVEWAHQRLPLPAHWFLSSISTVYSDKPSDFLEVAKGGLFFLLGIEAISSSPVKSVSVVWKLHAMSVILLSGMEILGDEKSRDVYGILQNVYGEIVDAKKLTLQFEKEIHESYATFVEIFVDQFAAESYGDLLFGRQVAMYLRRSVDASVRIAAWNALSNARALELLPRVDECFMNAEGFLEPIEDNERILEAYVKSWVSGALDKAAKRGSVTFSVVLHHLSSFIFGDVSGGDMLSLRIKLAKSLLRDYSRKHQHEGMMVKLVCYMKPKKILEPGSVVASDEHLLEVEKRLQLFKEICDGHASEVEKLESCVRREVNARSTPDPKEKPTHRLVELTKTCRKLSRSPGRAAHSLPSFLIGSAASSRLPRHLAHIVEQLPPSSTEASETSRPLRLMLPHQLPMSAASCRAAPAETA
ncbi:RNA polymerase ii-associated protein 1 [Phtheirospermum japonicum]|uniref:RNA polymerase ii-associated protein 1 n=1 Tax=Phtheirospermum japonicum TaxID=374723 RepID=A0A830D265_9LAMI|nr:RNA polymerase ii-associated protein 1 [Phtheirospermum japonicum]